MITSFSYVCSSVLEYSIILGVGEKTLLSIQITAYIWKFQRGGGDIALPSMDRVYGYYFFGVKILDTKDILENKIYEALLIILRKKLMQTLQYLGDSCH